VESIFKRVRYDVYGPRCILTSNAIASKLRVAKYLLLLSAGELELLLRLRLYLRDLTVHTTAMAATDSVKLPPVSFRGIVPSPAAIAAAVQSCDCLAAC
jgi:hypothetical protein